MNASTIRHIGRVNHEFQSYPATAHAALLSQSISDVEDLARLWPTRFETDPRRLQLAVLDARVAWRWISGESWAAEFSFQASCRFADVDPAAIIERVLAGLTDDLRAVLGCPAVGCGKGVIA